MAIVTTNDEHYKNIAGAIKKVVDISEYGLDGLKPSEMATLVPRVYKQGVKEGKTEGYQNGYDAGMGEGKIDLLKSSKYMNAKASGECIAVNDVSPVEHEVIAKVSSKNILPYPYAMTTTTKYGITFTDNGDGTITANGTATADTYFEIATDAKKCPYVPVDTTMRLSGCPSGGSNSTYFISLDWVGWYEYGNGVTMPIKNETLAENWRRSVRINVKKGVTVENLVFKPQIVYGTTATAYTPYIADVSTASVMRYGKNLFKLQDFTYSPASGSNNTVVKDGILTITYNTSVGTSTPLGTESLTSNYVGLPVYPAGTYTFYAELCKADDDWGGDKYPYLAIKLADGTSDKLEVGIPKQVSQSFTPQALKFDGTVNKHKGGVYQTYLQVVCGESSGYEPFIEPTAYPVEGDTANIKSISPSMTLLTDTQGVLMECSYLRDIDTYIDNLMMNVAMTGG